MSELREIFAEIYARKAWGRHLETASGKGATLEATEGIREALPNLWRELGIETLADVPCGDCHWIRHTDRSMLRLYWGMDIVPDLIAANLKTRQENEVFILGDMTEMSLPPADMILSKDGANHLSNELILKFLDRVSESESRYLCMTTTPGADNEDGESGSRYRQLDFSEPPFSLGRPATTIEYYKKTGCIFGVWEL